jgi:hypothetical protein
MTCKKHFPFIFGALLCACVLINHPRAELATNSEMDLVAENWLTLITHEKGDWSGHRMPTVSGVRQMTSGETVLARVYSIEPGGYVVVPALKALAPVKATSEEVSLDVDQQEGMAALLREVFTDAHRAYIHYYGSLEAPLPKSGGTPFGTEYRAKWDRFTLSPSEFKASLSAKDRDTLVEVGPLMTAHWHQGEPYNDFCPWGDGGRCVVGCVATAAAMIMDYHEWPPYGNGIARYYWHGDESCGGNAGGGYLSVNLDDNYDWANITDYTSSSGPIEEKNAVAELNYEVGVAYKMNYGRCGSGAFVFDGEEVFPDYFRYKDSVVRIDRIGYTKDEWFSFIAQDIDDSLPISYRITRHAIVSDGYRVVDGLDQHHLNYGWNSSHTTWYTVDYLYCPWEGCTTADQMMLTRIIPDRDVIFYIDTTIGYVPFTVNVEGASILDVDQWTFDFGDGDSAGTQTATHTYDVPGNYDLTLEVTAGGQDHTFERPGLVIAIADTLRAPRAEVHPDSGGIVELYARNSAPLRKIDLPLDFSNGIDVVIDSFSMTGCRTETFDTVYMKHYNPGSQATFHLSAGVESTAPVLPAGAGPILKVFFSTGTDAEVGDSVQLDVDGYASHTPGFFGDKLDYVPALQNGALTCMSCCAGTRGNVNADEYDRCDIADLIYLVTYMFSGGPESDCFKEADIDASGSINVADLTFLVSYMFSGGFPPQPCY